MTSWNRVQGDISDTITPIIQGVDDLTDVASVEAHVWKVAGSATTLTAAVADADACTVTVELGTWLSSMVADDIGVWYVEFQMTWVNGDTLTWPNGTLDTITVRRQGS